MKKSKEFLYDYDGGGDDDDVSIFSTHIR
ncbi:hypothetical protein L195_g064411, partial [Trifolium pratense]